jgi:hypothetical protein
MPLSAGEEEEEDAVHSIIVAMDTNRVGIPLTEVWRYRYVDGTVQKIRMMWLPSCIVSLEYKSKIHASKD